MNHLEQLIGEYYDWKGYLVKRNIKVGRRGAGGWEMELDVVAYHPEQRHLVHLEASLDAHSWAVRAERYGKKFSSGEKYILQEVFTWLAPNTVIERIAVFPSASPEGASIAGAVVWAVDAFVKRISDEIRAGKVMSKEAIPEQYPLLRTMQLTLRGYHRTHP